MKENNKVAGKVINDYEVIDIALNPAYMTKDDLSNIKKKQDCQFVGWKKTKVPTIIFLQ